MRQIRVYGASKLDHAKMWIDLRARWPEVHFTARWPYFVGVVPDAPEAAGQFWLDDEADVARADVVLVYAGSKEEKLRGALVEAGMALGMEKLVYVIGDHPDFSTWQFHPNVKRMRDMDEARERLGVQLHFLEYRKK